MLAASIPFLKGVMRKEVSTPIKKGIRNRNVGILIN